MNGERGYAAVALSNPKTPENVGGVLRACACYGASLIVVAGDRGRITSMRVSTDTTKAWTKIPTIVTDDVFDAIPYDCIPVAVELVDGAQSLTRFIHPQRAFYIFGPEDGTLGRQTIERCKYVVQIPTNYCMNLAATANVVLYDRLAKRSTK